MPVERLSAETKLVLALVSVGVLTGALGAELVCRGFEERVEAVGATVLDGAADAFRGQQAAEEEKLAATLDGLMASRELRAAFLKRDRAGLQRLAAPVLAVLRERDRVTHWYFHEPGPARRVFLRVHRPELFGETVDRITLRRAIESGEAGAGLELGRTAFALRVVRPWVVDGQLIGYMELAEEVGHFLTAMKGRTGDDYGLLVQRRLIDEQRWVAVLGPRVTNWNARADLLVVDTTDAAAGMASFEGDVERLPDGGLFLGERERAGRAEIRGVFPVPDAAGRKVAALFVVHDFTAHHRAVQEARRQAWVVMLLLSAAAAALMVALARGLIFVRLGRLRRRLELRVTDAASRHGHGDLARIETLIERTTGASPAGAGPGPAGPGPRTPGD